jgi:hypothetical protein
MNELAHFIQGPLIPLRPGDLIRLVGEGTLRSNSPSGTKQDFEKHEYAPKLDVISQVLIGAGRTESWLYRLQEAYRRRWHCLPNEKSQQLMVENFESPADVQDSRS